MRRFENRTVIVTGAASPIGIGFATARRIASEGGNVVLTDLDTAAVEARAAELGIAGQEALAIRHDVTREASWQHMLASSLDRFGRVDGLVNNAGIAVLAPVETLTCEMWQRQMDVNLTSVFLGCRLLVDHFRSHGGGAIVNVSSAAGLVGMRRTTAYGASKGGVRLFTKALAIECAADNIRVNSVHPGVIETDIQTEARRDDRGDSRSIAASVPLGRPGNSDELGSAIAFLMSEDASYITGAELVVDGGLTAQ